MISIIAALGKNRELGKDNELLWHIPDDLKRFKRLTMGHPVIMGRKTFESIGKPLPGRTNIVVTHNQDYAAPNFAYKLEGALEEAEKTGADEIFVIGGAQIYAAALPYADRLYLTLVDDDKESDTYFPPYETTFTKKIADEAREWNGLKYRFVTLAK